MSRLPLVTAKELEKLLFQLGFVAERQKGSHVFYRHEDSRYTTIPHHKGRQLGRSLIRRIINQIDLTVEEYKELLGK